MIQLLVHLVMPTLSEKGKIVLQPWHSDKEIATIEDSTGIEYLMSWIADRMWENKITPPKIKIRGIGDRVLVLRSGTGSGKSTMIPPALYNSFYEKYHSSVIITQPRILTTQDIPFQIIRYNPNFKLGENIGYQTGVVAKKAGKGILFSTVGILLQFLRTMEPEQFMKKYKFILIDEVHERTIELDSALFYLKKILTANYDKPECPFLILMSGTFQPATYMKYFSCPEENFIDILGLSYPIEDNFTKYNLTNYPEYIVDLVEKIHVDNISDVTSGTADRDIMIFIKDAMQIKAISDRIHWLNAKVLSKGLDHAKKHSAARQKKHGGASSKSDAFYLAPISLMSENVKRGSKQYMDLFSPIESITVDIYQFTDSKDNSDSKNSTAPVRQDRVLSTVAASRRIIIATNAAESGITIDTLKYCIDSGYVKESCFNPNYGCTMLVDKNITQANSVQRRGRVGRKAPGIFYACYTRAVFEKMAKNVFSDIIKEDVSGFLLATIVQETSTALEEIPANKKTKYSFQKNQFDQQWYHLEYKDCFNASELDFIQYPSADSISYATEKLHGLGFIDHEYKPTLFGLYASKFRKLRLENIRMILAGYHHGANVLDLITIACCVQVGFELGIKKNKYTPRNPLNLSEQESFYYYKLIFCDEFVEYLFIWNDFMEAIGNIGNMLEKNKKKYKFSIPVNYLPKWCETNSFKYEGLLKVIDMRDEIIADMLTMGLNPYYNSLSLSRGSYNLVGILRRNLQEGMEEIKKIKYCIYEGFRFNLLIWNPASRRYTSNVSHMDVTVSSKLVKPLDVTFTEQLAEQAIEQTAGQAIEQTAGHPPMLNPQKIIVSDITLREKYLGNGLYEFTAGDVSVMDGFVDVDVGFLQH